MVPKLQPSFFNSFFVPLDFINLMRNYVVLRTSLQFHGLPMQHLSYIDSLNLVYVILGMLWQSFYLLLTKGPKDPCLPTDKNISQPDLTCYKRSYSEDNQFTRSLAHMKNSFRKNSKGFMLLLMFMTLEYPLILEIHLQLFQKQYNSLINPSLGGHFRGPS